MPSSLTQCDCLTDKPGARPDATVFIAPMFRLVNRLAVEFEHEPRMTGFQKIVPNILVASHTRIRARVKTLEIAHPCAHAHRVSPIAARVSPQPRFGSTVTTLARNAFIGVRGRGKSRLSHRLEGRVANRAAGIRLRFGDTNSLCDATRACIE